MSKNRGNTKTNLYIAAIDGKTFTFQGLLEVPALIINAYYHESKQICLLLGNQLVTDTFQSFISVVQFKETATLALIKNLQLAINEQVEAITLKDGNVFYVGSEKENGGNLYEVTIEVL